MIDLMEKGNRVVLDASRSFINDKKSGTTTSIHKRGKKPEVGVWVPTKIIKVSQWTVGH